MPDTEKLLTFYDKNLSVSINISDTIYLQRQLFKKTQAFLGFFLFLCNSLTLTNCIHKTKLKPEQTVIFFFSLTKHFQTKSILQ